MFPPYLYNLRGERWVLAPTSDLVTMGHHGHSLHHHVTFLCQTDQKMPNNYLTINLLNDLDNHMTDIFIPKHFFSSWYWFPLGRLG